MCWFFLVRGDQVANPCIIYVLDSVHCCMWSLQLARRLLTILLFSHPDPEVPLLHIKIPSDSDPLG